MGSPQIGSYNVKVDPTSTRPTSTRVRQNSNANSIASAMQNNGGGLRPSSSSSNHPVNGNNIVQELEQATLEHRSTPTSVPHPPVAPLDSLPFKREEQENSIAPESELPVNPVVTRAGRISKTSTPISATFPDSVPMARNRSSRNNNNNTGSNNNNGGSSHASSESNVPLSSMVTTSALSAPPKRSHKKGASSISRPKPDSLTNAENNRRLSKVADPSDNDSADDDNDGGDDDNQRYCICGGVSYGDMIACDNDKCEKQWFHMACIGLKKAPGGQWYCEDCKAKGFAAGAGGRRR
jgi:hypothetical protein